jgi:hypothetical protein
MKVKNRPVFTHGKRYIVQDIDSHSGGTWKMARSVDALRKKDARMGTYDHELNWIAP